MPLFLFMLSGLFSTSTPSDIAQEIVDQAIQAHGGRHYEQADYSFDFRDKTYEYHYDKGAFKYERKFMDKSERHIQDILTNERFERYVDDQLATNLAPKKIRGYSNAVNSVHYFAFLPYFLNDAAVQKEYLGDSGIKGHQYNEIRVTFAKEGGGDDHDDIYIYWFNKKTKRLDYLAYSFHVNGGGVRFRAAYNARFVGDILFQDYVNYKHDKNTPVAQLDELYSSGQLQELSRIELKNIKAL